MLKFWKKKDKHNPQEDQPEDKAQPLPEADIKPDAEAADQAQHANDATLSKQRDTIDKGSVAEDSHAGSPPVHQEAQVQQADTFDTTDEDASDDSQQEVTAEADDDNKTKDKPKKRWRKKLAGSGFARGLSGLFKRNPKLDDELLDELETTLITADVGVSTSMELVEDLRKRMHKREFADSNALLSALRSLLLTKIEHLGQPLTITTHKPFAMLVVGVNGVGKTTTIGKLTQRYKQQGHKVILAAGDTFRAAAVEQLKEWGQRNQVAVISQGQGADSASVIYDAMDAARARQADLLIADTAGRLHTQGGLMDELAKVIRVIKKLDNEAPHEVLMVIDGTTGQNAISQLRQFLEVAGITGLVVTKLDGTAKGGVIFALAKEFDLPIRFVGLGEGIDDLQPFDAEAFVDGLLPDDIGHLQDTDAG